MPTHDQPRAPERMEHTEENGREAPRTSSQHGGETTFGRDVPADRRSEATAQQSIRGSEFDAAYTAGPPPWDIGRPQPAFVALAEAGRITSKVLDVGCGTGEHALFLGQRGLDVLGLDLSAVAVAQAQRKAQARGVVTRFVVGNALELLRWEETFDTVIDSGLLHVFSDADRARLVAGLHAVLRPLGYLHLLTFNEHASLPGPRRLTQAEIHRTFAPGWEVEGISPSHFELVDGRSGAEAWLASIRRLPAHSRAALGEQ